MLHQYIQHGDIEPNDMKLEVDENGKPIKLHVTYDIVDNYKEFPLDKELRLHSTNGVNHSYYPITPEQIVAQPHQIQPVKKAK